MFKPTDKLIPVKKGMQKTMTRCKRALVTSCKGRIVDPLDEGAYVYWCGLRRNGWHATPCEHYPHGARV